MSGSDDAAALQTLLAERDIRNVVLRYCRGVDRLDEEVVRSCYHPGAHDEHGSFSGDVEAYIEWSFRLLRGYDATMHFIGNQLVEVQGDVARAESYGVAYHRKLGGEARQNLTTGFRFVDRFEGREGDWRIARRVATTEWVRAERPGDQWPIPDHLRVGSRDRSDPVYETQD